MEYTLLRSKRKTLSIQVTREGLVVVRSPKRCPQADIDRFIDAHRQWIEKHLGEAKRRTAIRDAFTFADGQKIYYLGAALAIQTGTCAAAVADDGGALIIPAVTSDREKAVELFLRRRALELFAERIAFFAPQLGVSPKGIRITSAKTRWGSCSGKGAVCFSFRLVQMPPPLIDYVVVHELCHLLEHNHSPRFYAHVARILPDYRERQAAIRAFGRQLNI